VGGAVTMYQPGWQQPWWSGIHCTPSWLCGCSRHWVCDNAPVEWVCWAWPATIQI